MYLTHLRKASKFPAKDRITIAMKNRIESHWNGFFSLSATFGRKLANRIQRVSGMPSRMNIVLNTSHKGMTKVGTSAATLAV